MSGGPRTRVPPPRYMLAGDAPAWPPPRPFWVTMDSDVSGRAFGFVEVWRALPVRMVNPGVPGAYWMTAPEWNVASRYGRYARGAILAHHLPTLPDDDRQVVRYD